MPRPASPFITGAETISFKILERGTCKEVCTYFIDQNERRKKYKQFENNNDAKCGLFTLFSPCISIARRYPKSCIC